MRAIRLARVAAQAEALRLRHLLRRQVTRVALAAVAAVFALGALIALHIAGAMALAEHISVIQSVLVVAGADAVVAIVLLAVAARDVPGAVEREALQLRRTAVAQAMDAVVLATIFAGLRRVRSLRDLYGVVASALAAWIVGARC